MFSKTIEEIFNIESLKESLQNYKNAKDFNEILLQIESGDFLKNIEDGFIPQPVKYFEIEKNENEKRELALSSTSSKVIQKILVKNLENIVKFSNRSYAYRKNKGTLKAINRTKDFLNRNFWVAKADIDNFFDSINQDILIQKLNRLIQDKQIVKLIALFLKNGMLKQNSWIDKEKGVYQGDNLSPWLSNLYLNDFDHYLEQKHIDFIRYADDILFFAKHKRDVIKFLDMAEGYLNSLSLTFGKDKTIISNIKNGFTYLGLFFKEKQIIMSNDKLQKKISKLSKKTKNSDLYHTVEIINEHIDGINRYYLKILTDTKQFHILQDHIDNILIKKIVQAKQTKTINKKSKFIQILSTLNSYTIKTAEEKQKYIDSIVNKAYEKIALQNPLKSAKQEIAKSKSAFLKENIKSSELILAKFGLYVGVSRGKVTIKEYGKIIKQLPFNTLSRIIVLSPGINISSNLIYQCSKNKIDIDFIHNDAPYAQITFYKSIPSSIYQKQLNLLTTPKALEIAKAIVKAKSKNQLNLIKYFARYRKDRDKDEFESLKKIITKIETIQKDLKTAKDKNSLMGYEGAISNLYWSAFGILIDMPDFKRVTQNAPDTINQALNYGYGFLYHRIQSAIIKTGLSLYHSFFHSEQTNKPTLVFDLIEEFRQPVVDREIISILNKKIKLSSSKGKLTKESVKVITQNIQERVVTPTKYKKAKYKITSIIDSQVLQLHKIIENPSLKYKGFIAKY